MNEEEQVIVQIANRRWTEWDEIEIHIALDSFSTITFSGDFEPDRKDMRDAFRPFTYQDLTVEAGRAESTEPVFTGQLILPEPKETGSSRVVECSGYALPAVIEDTSAPISAFPIEFNGLTLFEIAADLVAPFDLVVESDADDDGPTFRRVKIKPDQTIADFLGKLARARGFVMNDSTTGNLRFLSGLASGAPVAIFDADQPPKISVVPTFNPQAYFSEITGFARRKAGDVGSSYTVRNPKLLNRARPRSFISDDTNAPDLPTAVQNKMARMFGNMIAYVIELPTWRDAGGELWKPNTLVSLKAPGAMVYNQTTLLIRDVFFRQTKKSTTASLGLVLPGSFSGQIPEVFPWDE